MQIFSLIDLRIPSKIRGREREIEIRGLEMRSESAEIQCFEGGGKGERSFTVIYRQITSPRLLLVACDTEDL